MLDVIEHPLRTEGAHEGACIRELRLARPPVNALNIDLLRALIVGVEAAAKDAALVITGQPGMFSGGLDVRGMLALDRDAIAALFIELWRVQYALARSPVPVVFGITGHSPAGGTVLAIHGDYRVMAQGEFRMGLNEVQVGLFPGDVIFGAFQRLVGGHAAQLLSRGALIDPATALRVGLVDELCEASQVATRALAVAREFTELPREPMLRTRAMTRRDLIELFGDHAHGKANEREFAVLGVEMWFVPDTQERLKKAFLRKGD